MFFKANYRKFFLKNYPIAVLFLLEIILFIFNYKSGTWLLGWDNTVPEFNFPLSLKRNLFAVWQEYRGLGLYDGMAHAANTTHTLFLWFLAIFIPNNMLRYLFTFLMHFLGGVGVYFLILNIIRQPAEQKSKITSLIGSLFYLLNIGTVQMFYTPLEVFSVHFAALPWLTFFLIKFLKSNRRKDLIGFFVLSLLFTPQAFVPTVFLVYLLTVFVILAFHSKTPLFIKKTIAILGIMFVVNAFWALPYFYGVFSNAAVISSSKINQMANQDIILKNKAFGDFRSVALIRGFSLNYTDLQTGGVSGYMMKSWKEHIDKIGIQAISWLFFGLVIMGIFEAIKSKQKETYPFLILFAVSFLMLANDVPVISIPFDFLSKHVPFFTEAFRFVFTKFSILYIFCYSIFLALGVEFLFKKTIKTIKWGVFVLLFGFIFYYSSPVFEGNFFYKNLKVAIPKEYFSLIDYFEKKNQSQRLMVLPQPDFWGWTYYDWGFRGSGFVWQGLAQASMDGAFLPWSQENENYYWQVSRAIYSRDQKLLESVLEKYQINWLVVDQNIIISGSPKVLYLDEIEQMIGVSDKIKLAKQFGNIKVYEVDLQAPVKDFVFLAENLPETGPEYKWNNEDIGFTDNGYYLSNPKPEARNSKLIYYPFRSLFTGRKQEELEFGVEDKGDYFVFRAVVPEELASQQLVVDSQYQNELTIWDENLASRSAIPEVWIIPPPESPPVASNMLPLRGRNISGRFGDDLAIEVRWPKEKGFYSYDSLDDIGFLSKEVRSCNPFNIGEMKQGIIREEDKVWLRFESVGSGNCLDIDLPVLTHKIGYLVKIESRHIKGKQLLFSVINKDSKRNEIETYLSMVNGQWSMVNKDFFIIPPMEEYGQGYTLHFDNVSIGRQETVNDLGRVEVYPIPYRFLKELKIVDDSNYHTTVRGSYLPVDKFQVEHPNPSFYKIKLGDMGNLGDSEKSKTLILSQAYHPGWLAYKVKNEKLKIKSLMNNVFPFVFGEKLDNHVKVNSWANGWQFSNETMKQLNNPSKADAFSRAGESMTIYIFFWPQLLEYLGFGLLIGIGAWAILFYGRLKRGKRNGK